MANDDPINHPSHYTVGDIEVIDFIEDWELGYHAGNVIKYVCRAPYKNDELEDLKKAQWYLNRRIEQLEGEEDEIRVSGSLTMSGVKTDVLPGPYSGGS